MLSTQFADEARRGSFGTALDLADGLGKRAWPIGRLQRLIFSACGSTDERTARHAIELAMSNPSTRDDIGHALLSKDPSTVVIPAVRRWIGNDRTDLLDRVLTGPSTGRFVDPDARQVPLFDSGFGRWTPRQQDLYATVLVEHAADETVPMPDRLAAALHSPICHGRTNIRQLWRLTPTSRSAGQRSCRSATAKSLRRHCDC